MTSADAGETALLQKVASGRRSVADHAGDWRGGIAGWWSLLANRLFSLPPERLIRFGRFTFSAFALLAIYLDPTQPARNVEETYTVLIAYVAYGGILASCRCAAH